MIEILLALLVLLSIAVVVYRKRMALGSEASLPEPEPKPQGEDSGAFPEEDNDFAVALYGRLRQSNENLFFSPFSIRMALGMTHAGARGETAEQISSALRFSSSEAVPHVAFASMIQRLNAAGGGLYEMAVANSLWGQEGATLRPEFLDLIAKYYGGEMNLVDFETNAEAARTAINRWVEEKTKRKIQELLAARSLDRLTRLVLVNAVYFKGQWTIPFRKAATRDEPFHLEGNGTVRAPLMRQQERVRYLQGEGYQAVDLAYRGDDLSMLVLLPDERDGLMDLEKRLSARMLHACIAQMSGREVKLFLPRFKVTWGAVNVSDQLKALGMPLAFTRFVADFSGINGHEPPHDESLFISAVFHKAFVEVNEEGTEAAAATGVVLMVGSSAPPSNPTPIPVFRADHPFLFAIRDRKSGTILFLGRIADPTSES